MGCHQAKEFLSDHQVAFTEFNLLTKPSALLKLLTQFKRFGPTVVVNGEPISARDKKRIGQALGLEQN